MTLRMIVEVMYKILAIAKALRRVLNYNNFQAAMTRSAVIKPSKFYFEQ